MLTRTTSLVLPLLALSAVSWCGGPPAESSRPKDQTYAAAMGETGGGTCRDVETYGEPLVVDWKPEQRGDLEVLMKDGIAIVSYSCKGLKLLKDCKVDGKYGFLGMTKKEQLVRLENADELKANLPLAGAGLAANIGGDMERGATLDVALVMIGKKKTTWAKISADDLGPDCEGATHFVKGATVGAFVMETGSKAQARTAAQILGAGASGASASAKNVRNQDGDPGDCGKASPDAPAPPSQCQALVRLELKAIAPKRAADAAAKPAPDAPKPSHVDVVEEPCPKGLVFANGKCTEVKNATAFLCDPINGKECVEQCAKGHAGSCGAAGSLYATGQAGLPLDETKARELLGKGCDGSDAKACVNLGVLLAQGRGGAKDPAGAAKNFERGCAAGEAKGCGMLGGAYRAGDGVGKDVGRAATLLRQGCDGGDDVACGALGRMLAQGEGVPKDATKATDLLKRACDGGQSSACIDLGMMLEIGKDAPKNLMLAKLLYQRACFRSDFEACLDQGRLELGQGGDSATARRAFESACSFKQLPVACAVSKILFGGTQQVFAGPAAAELATRCNAGSARDCASAGVLNIATGNAMMGNPQIERACTQGEPLACAIKNKK